jgi:hypothetical protein
MSKMPMGGHAIIMSHAKTARKVGDGLTSGRRRKGSYAFSLRHEVVSTPRRRFQTAAP